MPKRSTTVPTFQFEENEIEALRKALSYYGAYMKATNRDSRPYEVLADRLTRSDA